MKKKEFYSIDNILSLHCMYNILFGERSNGKSYAVKYYSLKRAYENDEKFVYLRRWREDISLNRADMYWRDMVADDKGNRRVEEITNGEYDDISIYRNDIYLAKTETDGKKTRGKHVGRVVVLSADTHEKSLVFTGYYRVMFEEFITDKGYLPNEVGTFMSLISTILRRREGEVFLIGNNLDRTCPYFREWELSGVAKQEIGTIDKYEVELEPDEDGNIPFLHIACEYCDNTSTSTKMIFGNKMITKGEWYSEEKPHLPLDRDEYKKHFSMLIEGEIDLIAVDLLSYKSQPLLYVRPSHRRWTDRSKYDIIISREYDHDMRVVTRLDPTWTITPIIRRLLDIGKVCYEDNLTGTTFSQILKNRNIF